MKMKKMLKKLSSVFLAVCIFMVPFAQMCSAAVVYPEGITQEQTEEAIVKTDTLISNFISQSTGGTVADLILPEIYSGTTLSMLLLTIYQSLVDYESTLATIGLDTSVSAVAANLTAYPEIYNKLITYSSWSDVNLDGINWNLTSKYEFADAIAAMLAPLNDVIYTLLCNGTYSFGSILIFNNLMSFSGDYGYENAIVPMLENLGCTYIKDATEFYAQAETDKNSMISNIVLDLVYYVEELLASPAQKLSEDLPNIVYFLINGGFSDLMNTLIEPAKVAIMGFDMTDQLFSTLSDTLDDPTSFTETDDFSDIIDGMTGESDFELPEIDYEELANCGTLVDGKIVSNTADAFIIIMTLIIDTVKLNQDSISNMTGVDSSMIDSMSAIFDVETSDLVAMIINLLTASEGSSNDYQWVYSELVSMSAEYNSTITYDNAVTMVNGMDALIEELIAEMGDGDSLSTMISTAIYSNDVVTMLMTSLYSMLDTDGISEIVGLLGLPTSPSDLTSYLTTTQFSSAKSTLSSASSWTSLDGVSIDWGFEDGDKSGFITAVTYVLLPMSDIFYMLLAEGNLTLFGAIDFYGSNGYETAIIPLLENFGVAADSIKTYEDYKSTASTSLGITDIVTSFCSLIDQLIAAPVYTATAILPNIIYFIENTGIETCIQNLLYPLESIATSLGMDSMIDDLLADYGDIDILSSITSSIPDMVEGLSISSLDLTDYLGYGTLVEKQSKATYNGEYTTMMYVQSNQADVLITMLRYLVDMMKTPGNDMTLDSMLSGITSGNEMFETFSSSIVTQLNEMSTDETIAWIYGIFFQERVTSDSVEDEEVILPTIIYQNESNSNYFVYAAIAILIIAGGVALFIKRNKINQLINELKEKHQKKKEEKLS